MAWVSGGDGSGEWGGWGEAVMAVGREAVAMVVAAREAERAVEVMAEAVMVVGAGRPEVWLGLSPGRSHWQIVN